MPSDAINPETPAKQGSVVEIQCQTDTEYDSCIFTHTNPFYVGQNIQQDTIVSMRIYLLSTFYLSCVQGPDGKPVMIKCTISHDSAGTSTQCEDDNQVTRILYLIH